MKAQNHKQAAFADFLGVDVGKEKIAVHDSRSGKAQFVDNNRKAIFSFFKSCNPTAATLVICEASGGYEANLLACASDMGIAAHRASASKIKSFIASYGTLSKTDLGDAMAIARYGAERHHLLDLWAMQDGDHRELQALVLRREDLVSMRAAEKNRLQAPGLADKAVRMVARSCKTIMATLTRQIEAIEKAIDKLVGRNEIIRRKYDILVAIKGIGKISAIAIIAHMPEIGTCTRRKAASLAGLAPHPKDSGNTIGYRATRGGRQPLKKALFMPAMVTARGNTELSTHYKNLVNNGKKPIVAMVAIMRKIIVIANAKVRDGMNLQQS